MDTHDKRFNWRNDMNGDRAFVIPEGKPSKVFGAFSWAGPVSGTTEAMVDWSLRNRQMAFIPDEAYRLCFSVLPLDPNSQTPGWGIVRIKGGGSLGTAYVVDVFQVSPRWRQICTRGFQVKTSDNILQFGHFLTSPDYLVDDIRLEKQ